MRTIGAGMVLLGLGVSGCVADSADVFEETSAMRVDRLRYRQVDITAGPADLDGWVPMGLSDRAEVLGLGFDCDDEFIVCSFNLLRRAPSGQFTVLAKDFSVNVVNGHGDAGGCIIDAQTSAGQAAVFRANGHLELIPPLPGEVTSCVNNLSDSGVVVVVSFNQASEGTTYVFDRGRVTPFTLPLASVQGINDRGQLAGIVSTPAGDRAYRFASSTSTTTILEPVPPDPDSWGRAINRKGEVLGYSFEFGGVERIGKWNSRDEFEIQFVEGTTEFPTVSNRLMWNEEGLIVISDTTDGNTYLVPEPGVRLNLADLVGGAPVAPRLFGLSINERADFAASTFDGSSFLFLRK